MSDSVLQAPYINVPFITNEPNATDVNSTLYGDSLVISNADTVTTKIGCDKIITPTIQVTDTTSNPSNKDSVYIVSGGLTIMDGGGTSGVVITKNGIEKRGAKRGGLFATDGSLATPITTSDIAAMFG